MPVVLLGPEEGMFSPKTCGHNIWHAIGSLCRLNLWLLDPLEVGDTHNFLPGRQHHFQSNSQAASLPSLSIRHPYPLELASENTSPGTGSVSHPSSGYSGSQSAPPHVSLVKHTCICMDLFTYTILFKFVNKLKHWFLFDYWSIFSLYCLTILSQYTI